MGLRDRLRGARRSSAQSAREVSNRPGLTIAKLVGKLAFLAILGALMLYAVIADAILLATLASLGVAIMLRAVLPTERFKDWVRSLWSGEATAERYRDLRDRGGR